MSKEREVLTEEAVSIMIELIRSIGGSNVSTLTKCYDEIINKIEYGNIVGVDKDLTVIDAIKNSEK